MPSSQWFGFLVCLLATSLHLSQADRWSRAGASPSQYRSNAKSDLVAATSVKTPIDTSTVAQDAPPPVTAAYVGVNDFVEEPDQDVPTLEECETDNIGYEIVTG